ncbi:probable 39S ribosomal protein L49, mitochondrial [Anoplophora glabripennis]|uniref:probable 39S ribosomal protein L49, mitochondrial n=1 Tax=Anoplophora glabripennis TaxID=217634 RepID=UPI00087574E2|nr:probable 39S ribosomal protein L49, mitochondrial [Anoplophora glabripennis]
MSIAGKTFKSIIRRCVPQKLFFRPSSYYSSPFLEDVGDITRKYEITKDPEDWKYVERILPVAVVPEPVKKDVYPSGWKPQGDNLQDQPYFVERTKNHMIPVYLQVAQNGVRRHTKVKFVKGDIWLLEKELREFLQKESFGPIRSQVNEFAGFIRFSGDFVNAIKYWLEQKQF